MIFFVLLVLVLSNKTSESYISSTSCSAGAAVLKAEKRKHKKYESVVSIYKFDPCAADTLNSFGEEPLDLNLQILKDLGRRLIESPGELRTRAYLTQCINISIRRDNAAINFATVSNSNKLKEIYCL
jgi:hypothetical protein